MIQAEKKRQNVNRYASGFAMIFAIFMVVALEAVIGGSFLNMIQHHRGVQRAVDRVRVVWAAEGTIDRTLKLLRDYAKVKGEFPNAVGSEREVQGEIPGSGESVQSFGDYIRFDWYPGFQGRHWAQTGRIRLLSVSVTDITDEIQLQSRKYRVEVRAKHEQSDVYTTVRQEVFMTNGRLFDFSVFYNEELEIAAGPDFNLQGPIFSNKNIYMMNDKGNTLRFVKAKGYGEHPEPYILGSAGNIYFYFKRAIGQNYLLRYDRYRNSVLDYDKYSDGTGAYRKLLNREPPYENFNCAAPYTGADCIELDANIDLDPKANSELFPPLFYYFENRAALAWLNGKRYDDSGNDRCAPGAEIANCIRAEDPSGVMRLFAPDHPSLTSSLSGWQLAGLGFNAVAEGRDYRTIYTPYSSGSYGDHALAYANISAAVAANNLPKMSSDPPLNPQWISGVRANFTERIQGRDTGLIQDKSSWNVSSKTIPIGNSRITDVHALIEPLTGTELNPLFPPNTFGTRAAEWDTPEAAKLKFQTSAGFNFYIKPPATNLEDISPDYWAAAATDPNGNSKTAARVVTSFYDYRIGLGNFPAFELDIAELMRDFQGRFDTNGDGVIDEQDDGILIYIHIYPLRGIQPGGITLPRLVRIVNGSRLPPKGLTIATNGRLWIEGDYNTFSYERESTLGTGVKCAAADEGNENCYCNGNSQAVGDWEDENCKVPSAAVFSDSFGVLSKQWKDTYSAAASLESRSVDDEAMVNTGLAVGFVPSQLLRRWGWLNCDSASDSLACHAIRPTEGGTIEGFALPCAVYNLPSPCVLKDGKSYDNEYYRDPVTRVYYVNKQSQLYRDAYAAAEAAAGGNRELLSLPDPNDSIQIPIFINGLLTSSVLRPYAPAGASDALVQPRLTGALPLLGISFHKLDRNMLYYGGMVRTCTCDATPRSSCLYGDELIDCGANVACVEPTGESSSVCGACRSQTCADTQVSPRIKYWVKNHNSLHESKYSGGLENLINFQEHWAGKKIRFSGTLSAPWLSKELIKKWSLSLNGFEPAYYGTSYYSAPTRIYDYNEELRLNPPPGTPGVFSFQRKTYFEGDDS